MIPGRYLLPIVLLLIWSLTALAAGPWPCHVIDNSSRGADGVRLRDVDGDGFLDITTPWEEGGLVRVYLNPGPFLAREPWPTVTVGKVGSPEDAVFVDLDGDGATDVVSSCEGQERTIYVHWAPKRRDDYRDAARWKTEVLGPARGAMRWMFTVPLEIDYRRGIDLVAGGRGSGARIGWFEAPTGARDMAEWKWHSTYAAGWVMSLIPSDMDGDGDTDILASDRKGEHAGTLWLENPGPGEALTRTWPEHRIGASGEEVMFLDQVDLDQDGFKDVLAAVQPRKIVLHQRRSRDGHLWRDHVIRIPETAGTAKTVRAADLDLDGKVDLVISCEHAEGNLSGVMWLSYKGSVMGPEWEAHDVSGSEGVKYDLVQTVDLDSDGDLDILTTEEASNLGVIWYENPTRRVGGQRASRPEPARHGMSSQP